MPDSKLIHPFPAAPAPGETIEVAPGILWIRMPLPFRLNHINIYLIEDGDGWAILDTASTSGVVRNGQPIERGRLSPGDVIDLGDTSLVVEDVPRGATAASPSGVRGG